MNYGQSIFGQNQSGTTPNMSGGQQGYPYGPGYSGGGQPAMDANAGTMGLNQNPLAYPQTPGSNLYQPSGVFPYQAGMDQSQQQGAVTWPNMVQQGGIPVYAPTRDAGGYGAGIPQQPQFRQINPANPYAQTMTPTQFDPGWNQPGQVAGGAASTGIGSNYERRNYTNAIPENWGANRQLPPGFNVPNLRQPDQNGRMTAQTQGPGVNGNYQAYYSPQQVHGTQRQNGWAGPEQSAAGFGAGAHPLPGTRIRPPLFSGNAKWIISCTALLFLFVLSFFLFKPWLCFTFAAFSVAFAVLLWVKPIVAENTRICLTVICAAMSVIAVVNALMPQNSQQNGNGEATAVVSVGVSGSILANQGGQSIPFEETTLAPTQTPAPDSLQTEAVERLESFFYYWSGNKVDEMLELCSPSWRSSQDIPKNALYSTMAGRIPLDYSMEKVSGTENDTSRTVTLVSNIDRKNGKDPVKYRMQVVMSYENGAWYVDPRSLASLDAESTTAAVSATPSPTPTPAISGDTILYYNPDGGMKYHLDRSCKSAHSKYLPFKGEFRYRDINNSQYAKMTPCNVCGAPLRPSE